MYYFYFLDRHMVKKIVNVVRGIYVSVLLHSLEENVFTIYFKIETKIVKSFILLYFAVLQKKKQKKQSTFFLRHKNAPIASLLGTQHHSSNVKPFLLKGKNKKRKRTFLEYKGFLQECRHSKLNVT